MSISKAIRKDTNQSHITNDTIPPIAILSCHRTHDAGAKSAFQCRPTAALTYLQSPAGSPSSSGPASETSAPVPVRSIATTQGWHDDAEEILRSHDLPAILKLLDFWPFCNDSLFRSTLHDRGNPVLNTLLIMAGFGDREDVAKLSNDQKLECICPLRPSPFRLRAWNPRQHLNKKAEDVAELLNDQSREYFGSIPFKDLVRRAFGQSADSVEEFLLYYVSILPTQIYMFLRMHPCQAGKYRLVLLVCQPSMTSSCCPLIDW